MRRGDDNQERLRRRGLIKPLSVPLRRGRPCFPCEREWPRGNDLNKPSIRPSIAHLSLHHHRHRRGESRPELRREKR